MADERGALVPVEPKVTIPCERGIIEPWAGETI
jgi:hypothetical protein